MRYVAAGSPRQRCATGGQLRLMALEVKVCFAREAALNSVCRRLERKKAGEWLQPYGASMHGSNGRLGIWFVFKAGFVFPGLCADFFELMHHHFRTFVHKPCMCLILNHICDVFGPVDMV